jgi:chemotaxis protein methyltransferase CheR
MNSGGTDDADEIELDSLLEAVRRRYAYDLRGYARASLRRRVQLALSRSGRKTLGEYQSALLRDVSLFERFLGELSVPVTEFFRDPAMFLLLRKHVVPVLQTYPLLKIWHAGCATGEEVYSMAILLEEEGLLERTQLYATDVNAKALDTARAGVYEIERSADVSKAYVAAGGKGSFSDYLATRGPHAKIARRLGERIVFSEHNLMTDFSFGEMDLVMCRNVLIYFGRAMQSRILELLTTSLTARGYLCVGNRESLGGSSVGAEYETINAPERIFRRLP